MPYTTFTGDTGRPWQVSPVYDTNSASPGSPVPLTGATGATFRLVPQGMPAFTGAGSTTLTSTAIVYAPAASDLVPTAKMEVQVTVQFPAGPLVLQPFVLQVLEAL